MTDAKTLGLIAALSLPTGPAMAQEWGELDCSVVQDALRAQSVEATALRMNVQVLETAIRGTDYAFFEDQIAPQLIGVETAAVENTRALGLVNALIRDRCPA